MKEINEKLLFPAAVVALIASVISIINDTSWYVYTPLLIVFVLLIAIPYVGKKHTTDFTLVWQEVTIDLVDKSGEIAIFENEYWLQAIKDDAHSFTHFLYCDGKITNVAINEGSVKDITKGNGITYVQIYTEKVIEKGKKIKQKLTGNYNHSFTRPTEFWESARHGEGARLKLYIKFPEDRICKEFTAYRIHNNDKTLLERQPERIILQGKPAIALEIVSLRSMEGYRLEWSW